MDYQKTFRQIINEFSVPFILSVAWTAYEWVTAIERDRTLPNSIKAFGAAFFFISWMMAQWFRIRKQHKVEGGLSSIENRTKQLVHQLEDSTTRMIGYSTGGDSFCELIPIPNTPIFRRAFALMHHGKFPLYDVHVRIVDLKRLESVGQEANDENSFEFPVLIPNHSTSLSIKVPADISHSSACHFNIFVTARNGSTLQMFQMTVVKGLLRTASNIEREGKVIFDEAAVDYPKKPDGKVDWENHLVDPRFRFDIARDIV